MKLSNSKEEIHPPEPLETAPAQAVNALEKTQSLPLAFTSTAKRSAPSFRPGGEFRVSAKNRLRFNRLSGVAVGGRGYRGCPFKLSNAFCKFRVDAPVEDRIVRLRTFAFTPVFRAFARSSSCRIAASA